MKPTLLILLAAASSAVAQSNPAGQPVGPPVWKTSTRLLSESTSVELRFPEAMVEASAIGQSPDPAPAAIAPTWAGTWRWRSQQSIVFTPSESPRKGTKYLFRINDGLRTLAGAPLIPAGPFSAEVAGVSVTDRYPIWFPPHNAPRKPEIVVQFDVPVDAAAAAPGIYFENRAGMRSSATVRQAVLSDIPSHGPPVMRQRALGFLKDGVNGSTPPKELALPATLVVSPVTPLPVGDAWALVVPAGTPAQGGRVMTSDPHSIVIGDVVPLTVDSCSPVNNLGEPKFIRVFFNKDLDPSTANDAITSRIQIDPLPPGFKFTRFNTRTIQLEGEFGVNQPYRVRIAGGLQSDDGLAMTSAYDGRAEFTMITPTVALPVFSANQFLHGRRQLDVEMVNMESVTVRVKAADGEALVYALRAYQSYTGQSDEEGNDEESNDEEGGYHRIAHETVPGRGIFEKSYALDPSLDSLQTLSIPLTEVLGQRPAGALFVTVEGRARPEWTEKKRFGAQAIIQITDIGLAWKVTQDDAFIYAFSEATGQPLSGVKLTALDGENQRLDSAVTGADGSAKLKRTDAAWLLAEREADRHAVSLGEDLDTLGMWHMGVPFDWEPAGPARRHVLIFTDRPVYLPGDTLYFKAIARQVGADVAATLPAGTKAVLSAFDSKGKLFVERDVTFSDSGSLDGSIDLPRESLGSYRLSLAFPPPAPATPPAEETEEESDESFDHSFLVEEYKPNTFAVKFDETGFQPAVAKSSLGLRARYLLGKPLSKAAYSWTAEIMRVPFQSEAFPAFNFLDSRETYYWDEDGYHDVPDESTDARELILGQGKSDLSDKGEATLEFSVPAAVGALHPRRISVRAEVTDLNQQTITERWRHTVHPSDFYLGIRQLDNVTGTGTPVAIALAAARNDGTPWGDSVQARVTVEKVSFHNVRLQTAGGGSNVRTDAVKEIVAEGTVTVPPKGQPATPFTWQPAAPGFYYVTARSSDPAGQAVEAVTSLQVFGEGWATWDEEDGVKIDLEADKEEYRPGDTAKILVKSPIVGRALVTVERRSVMHHFPATITGNAHAIDVPIDESMAPNAFISVFITRGANDSPKKHRAPEYKVGFCQLKVVDSRSRLQVAVATSAPEYRPGDEGHATATVTDGAGKPVPGAEVTFWAVDEGILSLTGFEAPDPWSHFHQPIPLAVQTGTSLQALVSEDPDTLEFTNKGYVIGGGGLESLGEKLRKDFRPLAFWQAALRTDAAGRLTTAFTVPDNLTEFRVIAVVSAGADRFGTGESRFQINKPLMFEPALPRFANVGDKITVKGILLNNTDQAREVDVSLTLDGAARSTQELARRVPLAARETRAVAFPIEFVEAGTARWRWSARTAGGEPALADATESTLAVGFAEPWLRDIQFAAITADAPPADLLAPINPELLEGRGEITLTLSNSTLSEASAAVVHLLRYPYGCVEQTTSSTIPWLTLHEIGDAITGPKSDPAAIAKVIQRGASRLLSMQTESGGLAYWPGGDQAQLWASAYGGMGLVLCRDAGAAVPASRLEPLAAYLSAQLRQSASLVAPGDLLDRAFACYTLALLGKAEPAYHEVLGKKARSLSHPARALLAMAVLHSGGTPADAIKILDAPLDPALEKWTGNVFDSRLTAMSLMVWARLDSKNVVTVRLTERLLQERTARGDWGSTYENAWALMALVGESRANAAALAAAEVTVEFDGASQPVSFPARPATRTLVFPFNGQARRPALRIASGTHRFLRAALDVKARPAHVPLEPRSNGFSIARRYEKVAPDGTLSPADALEVGDLVAVTLGLDIPERVQYLAVDDALPAIFEAVNSNFKSQASGAAVPDPAPGTALRWWSSFEELRTDRALFFADEIWTPGKYEIRYLARVAAEGTVTAPPARIEAMYDPDRYGLSGSRVISARQGDEKMAGR